MGGQYKPILCLDFDGVLHSYTTKWVNARTIPDPPVEGAMQTLLRYMEHFEVHILSSRSHQWGGRRAMKRWLVNNLFDYFGELCYRTIGRTEWKATPEFVQDLLLDPHSSRMEVAHDVVRMIHFPRHKPPALVTIDDRAIQFEGPDSWPLVCDLKDFKPWNKRKV